MSPDRSIPLLSPLNHAAAPSLGESKTRQPSTCMYNGAAHTISAERRGREKDRPSSRATGTTTAWGGWGFTQRVTEAPAAKTRAKMPIRTLPAGSLMGADRQSCHGSQPTMQ
ncbi:hypothetical protein AAFF_G00149810 [Aldrovandia affinis]|uniref:Uncharacterized protein n=1 Tax=Aldrovandia affinis TaxID=143900 RepID=A0AAD7RPM6_9TELE|nr:hypothetical protein AAFF_G00149810 [Aldrovandia affinis]